MGIDRKPKRSRDAVEHDTSWLQGTAFAETIPSCSKLWYNATAHPPKARGSEYLTTFTSKGESPINRMIGRGNMKTLWYQHSEQGGSSMISLRNRLPRVEPETNSQQAKSNIQFLSARSVGWSISLPIRKSLA
jgi:hypothetical protein